MQNTIICPHCKKPIELTQALTHQIEEELLSEEKEKHEEELAEMKEKLKAAEDTELELRKQKNKLDEEKRTFELDKQRQLDSEREKIRQKTLEEAAESQRLKEKEKDKVIDDLKKSLEEAQRKASQGSQQLQGEVAELDLETTLRNAIPTDVFEPIEKGVLGADIRQIVKSQRGSTCGIILWESKRTKAWSDGWITKLKQDRLNDKANVAVIVSDVLPDEAKTGMGFKDGIWVCSLRLVIPLALLLHKAIEDTARQKFISDNRQTRAERTYEVVTSQEFVQRVDSMIETYNEMLEQITRERNAFEKSWKLREAQVHHLMSGVSGIVGQLQEAAGSALPPIKNLELTDGSEKD
jgi:hypothetical protein